MNQRKWKMTSVCDTSIRKWFAKRQWQQRWNQTQINAKNFEENNIDFMMKISGKKHKTPKWKMS